MKEQTAKPWILERTLDELKAGLHAAGFPAFTARQVFQWVYHKNNQDPASWSNVARAGREKLAALYEMAPRPVLDRQGDKHGTRKYLIGLADERRIETVLIPEKGRYTFCLSSQVGCALACAFCATGTMGFRRDLTAGEIVSQVLTLKKELGDYDGRINLVFMGMGEPLLNYDNLARALRIICSADGLNVSPRHVTVSTAGILENLEKLERDFPQVKIAFSLNAPDPLLRSELMPISRQRGPRRPAGLLARAPAPPARHLRVCPAAPGSTTPRPRRGSWRSCCTASRPRSTSSPTTPIPGCPSAAPTRLASKNSARCCWKRD